MNRNLHSSSSLTEFARDSEEENTNLVSRFVNKITGAYNTSYNTVNDLHTKSDTVEINSCNPSKDGDPIQLADETETDIGVTSSSPKSDMNKHGTNEPPKDENDDRGRTIFSVLNRIGNIAAIKGDELRNYKSTELHSFWMPDEKAKECFDCSMKFTSFRRKHHCRLCGQIFCSKCCNQVVPGRIINCSGDLKVCVYCSKIVLAYLKSCDGQAKLEVDLEAVKYDLTNKLSSWESKEQREPTDRSFNRRESIGYQEEQFLSNDSSNLTTEDRRNILQHSNSLKSLHEDMAKNLQRQCCGKDFLTYIIASHKSSNKVQAMAILNAMLAAGFLVPIVPDSEQTEFEESLHYKLATSKKLAPLKDEFNSALLKKCGDLSKNYDDFSSGVTDCFHSFESPDSSDMQTETQTVKRLLKAYCDHEEQLILYLLHNENLHLSWASILIVLCARIANKFQLAFNGGDSMDIRSYVNIKKVPGESQEDCCIFGGTSFSKNVAHKDMAGKLEKPKVLLLQCPIMYERVEGKYISMETLMLQEKEYLRNVVIRVLSLKPHIIVAQKSVAGIAQQMFLDFGVTLICDVKRSAMERLARCMQCDIVTSIESNISPPRLGTCDLFFVKEFSNRQGVKKNIAFFEIFSGPKSYSFLLRGPNLQDLIKVKKVALMILYARYNWRFEMAFLLDISVDQFGKIKTQSNKLTRISKVEDDTERKISNQNQTKNDLNYKVVVSPGVRSVNLSQQSCINTMNPVLSISPYILQGRISKLQFESLTIFNFPEKEVSLENTIVKQMEKSYHNFLINKINTDYHGPLAEFRATGGKYVASYQMFKSASPALHTKPTNTECKNISNWLICQQFSVLFCNYYYNPKAAASFCAQPTLLTMKFYRQNDIMLGQFLERYCFRSYICRSCNLPMTDHIRRYVHSMGCIQVQCLEDATKSITGDILLKTFCTKCDGKTSTVRISQDTWCLSFAKYLELRFHGENHRDDVLGSTSNSASEQCKHNPHRDYIHQFSSRGYTVKFVYSSIEVWMINFPLLRYQIEAHWKQVESEIKENIENLTSKSLEIHSQIRFRVASSEHYEPLLTSYLMTALTENEMLFRHHIVLVESLIEKKVQKTYLYKALWNAQMILSDTVELWGPRINEPFHIVTEDKTREEVGLIKDHVLTSLSELNTSSKKFISELENIEGKPNDQNFSFEDCRRIENKITAVYENCIVRQHKVKLIVTEILPNARQPNAFQSYFQNFDHYALRQSALRVVANENDLSSIIAFSMTLGEYKKLVDNVPNHISVTADCASLNTKGCCQDGSIYEESKGDTKVDEDKKVKTKSYVEISFQDLSAQFSCKIYFAKEFESIRTQIFDTDGDEEEIRLSFIRSLSKSAAWEAGGGKSGLKFRKTIDGKYILKEMTKSDIAVFENFAPNYFEYINQCIQQRQRTLLAKIFGVFKITIKKKDFVQEKSLLVMENLFYGCDIKNKFDLKGSERNRLANPESNTSEIVLLDENLIKMSWSKPLYIFSYSKNILHDAINADSAFLERNSIMDYSLLVGLSSKGNVLVLGIIDYIRTFTFDKRLESLVKQTGILGGQGKLPTIIAPQRYRQRFMEAMERYFLGVPKC